MKLKNVIGAIGLTTLVSFSSCIKKIEEARYTGKESLNFKGFSYQPQDVEIKAYEFLINDENKYFENPKEIVFEENKIYSLHNKRSKLVDGKIKEAEEIRK